MLYTNPGDIVSDWFNGSGSTQVAAIESGRRFIGADIFYQDVRNARVAAAEPDPVTPLSGVSAESMAIWQAEARRIDAYPQSVPDAAADAVMLLDIFGEQCA
jgi:hypothetical protein